jgi:hypothetical protein
LFLVIYFIGLLLIGNIEWGKEPVENERLKVRERREVYTDMEANVLLHIW